MPHPKSGYKVDGKSVPGTTTIIGRFKDAGGLLYWACEQGRAIERGEIVNLYDKRTLPGNRGPFLILWLRLIIEGMTFRICPVIRWK